MEDENQFLNIDDLNLYIDIAQYLEWKEEKTKLVELHNKDDGYGSYMHVQTKQVKMKR